MAKTMVKEKKPREKKKAVYLFSEGNAEMKNTLGGKGANLAEMTGLKLPVPAGFTLTSDVCVYFMKNDGKYPKGV